MKGFVKAGIVAALGLAVLAAPVQAQAMPTQWNAGVGVSLPSSSGFNTGFNLRFGATVNPKGWPVWIRPEAAFDHFSVSCTGCGSLTAIGISGDAGYNFKSGSSMKPYVLGGLNITHQSFSVSGYSASATHLGIIIGGGIKFPLGNMKGYAELRYVSAGGGLDFIPISVGLMF